MRKNEKKFLIIILILLVIGLNIYLKKDKIKFYINIGSKYSKYLNEEYINSDSSIFNDEKLDKINSIDYTDLEYKNTNGKSLKLDMYGPKKNLSRGSPVIIYVHGGGWAYGTKDIPEELKVSLKPFREEGYTIISAEYELMINEEIFEKQVSDIKDVVRWIYKNKDIYDFDVDNIGIIGTSSGAHLGMMAAYSGDEEFLDSDELKDYSSKVKYIIDIFGPTDLSTLEENAEKFEVDKIILNSNRNKDEIISKFSPINYIDKKETNTLIIHSKADELVPYINAEKLYYKLKESKSKVEILELNETSHDLSNTNNKELFEIGVKILKYIAKNM